MFHDPPAEFIGECSDVAAFYNNIGRILVMAILLVCSAFFSGTETAYFNLSIRQRRLLAQSGHRLQILAARLLESPSQMLSCLLFGNMTVNVLFYATASVLTIRLKHDYGVAAAGTAAFVGFASLVLFGEILPKSLAYANSRSVSILAALPLYVCMKVLGPIVAMFRVLLVGPILGLILGRRRSVKRATTGDLKVLMEHIRKRGLISDDENRLLYEIVELGHLKVRHVMEPRVDMVTCSVRASREEFISKMRQWRMTKIAVYGRTIDDVVGVVYLRDLLLHGETPADKLVRPAHFVPEQQSVEQLLEHFRRSHTDMAVVVDEYGGLAGCVELEDVVEELIGDIERSGETPAEPETIGPFTYRLSGATPIHDWAEAFGLDLEEVRATTVGGLVTFVLGRIPHQGDEAQWKHLRFRVERMHKRRVDTVVMTIWPGGGQGS
ncbi:MAG TPA: HlyC/CorC family transporter [Phycisphaerales bacterium]|nr:HlyC/CorC family transporter [Phycisphaerales bacterium]